MPSSPKIMKESMIQAALELLIEKGNAGVTIKTVAARLGCSTQPISRQFGGMGGLRQELIKAAERYAFEKYYSVGGSALAAFEKSGWGAIDLAINEPNLFRFLYMGESGRKAEGGFLSLPKSEDSEIIRTRLAQLLEITPQDAERFMTTMILYTQGVATMIAANIVRDDRETIHRMVRETGFVFLKGLSVSSERVEALMGHSYGELTAHTEGRYMIMKNLIAICGLDCETCDARIATLTNDDVLREKTAKAWSEMNHAPITPEMINCEGCRVDGVKTPFCEALCPIRRCALGKGFATCGDCPDMERCENVGAVHKSDPEAKKRLTGQRIEREEI